MSKLKVACGRNILVKVISSPIESEIVMPQTTAQKNLSGVVVSAGKDVPKGLTSGSVVMCSAAGGTVVMIDGKMHAIMNWTNVLMIRHGKIYRPFGRRVLLERINGEVLYKNRIIIPACMDSSDQSLFGVVVMMGLHDGKVFDSPMETGDIVRIGQWSINIKEIDVNKRYHVIVPCNEIVYKCDHDTMATNYAAPPRMDAPRKPPIGLDKLN